MASVAGSTKKLPPVLYDVLSLVMSKSPHVFLKVLRE